MSKNRQIETDKKTPLKRGIKIDGGYIKLSKEMKLSCCSTEAPSDSAISLV